MKLRIKGNSLRLRITPSEMSSLLTTGRIEETICFSPDPQARLTYAVELALQPDALTLRHAPHEIAIVISSADADRWAGAKDVGLYGVTPTSNGPLELAVEKDFACLDKNDAENIDTFPNPNYGAVC